MSNNKQIAKNIIYSSVSFGINMCISFFFTPYLIRVVGKEAYGFFPLVNSIIGYTSIFTSAIGSMAGRFVTNSYYQNKIEDSKGYFNSVFAGYLFLSAVFTVLGIIFVAFITDILTVPDYLTTDVRLLFFFSVVTMAITMSTTEFSLGTYVKDRIDQNSLRDLASNITRILFILLLFFLFRPSIVFMSISAAFAALVTAGYNLHFKRKFLPEIDINIRKYYSWTKLKDVISYGIWSSLNALSCILSSSVNLLFTNIFINAEQTGDYSIAVTVPGLLTVISETLAVTFTPHFNILYAEDKKEELIFEIKKSIKILSFILAIPAGFFIVNSDLFFKLWVPTAYNERILNLSFITIIFTIFGLISNSMFSIFTITGKRKVPAFALLAVGLLNIISMFVLLKFTDLGIYAIAISGTVFLFLRDIFFTPIYCSSCLEISKGTFYPVLFKGVLSIIVVVVLSIIGKSLLSEISWISFIGLFGAISIVSLLINSTIILNKSERFYILSVAKKFIKRR